MDAYLENLKDVFIAECYELLEGMEKDLLALDGSGSSSEIDLLNSIFRGAHSIKGGAGALGFTPIYTFTHSAEALLDSMRSGKTSASPDTIDVLLNGVDIVRQMVDGAKQDVTPPETLGKDTLSKIEHLLYNGATPAGTAVENVALGSPSAAPTDASGYQIRFAPHRSMFGTGNDPLFIFRQLQSLGDMTIAADLSAIPLLDALVPEECYLAWNITLSGSMSEEEIRGAFEFVEDQADLTLTPLSSPAVEAAAPAAAPAASVTEASAPQPESEAPKTEAAPKKDAANQDEHGANNATVRVDVDKIDRMVNMVGELVIAQSMFVALTDAMPLSITRQLDRGLNDLSRRTRELQEAVMAVRMQPVKSIFSRMSRLTRDLSRQLNKPLRLITTGENTEVDKTIIEKLSDPITHMIRNAADHGLEMPDVRTGNGKVEEGTIRLAAFHAGGKIVIEIEDDGAGINRDRVLKKAKEKKLIPADAELTPEQIDLLIFLPGFSTAETVSTVSGRGVGMDVVDRNIKELGGSILVTNNPGKGSKFTITLPLTLAILDGMVVCVGSEKYIVPIVNMLETFRPKPSDIKPIADGSQLINIRGEFIPVLYLHSLFDIREAKKSACEGLVLIVETGRHTFGLVVDSLLGQQQVVIKSIDDKGESIPGISGATILGDGKISLILDITGLHKMLQTDVHHAKAA